MPLQVKDRKLTFKLLNYQTNIKMSAQDKCAEASLCFFDYFVFL